MGITTKHDQLESKTALFAQVKKAKAGNVNTI